MLQAFDLHTANCFTRLLNVAMPCDLLQGFWVKGFKANLHTLALFRRQATDKKPIMVGAVVSNHIGWADILVHMCHYFPSFVAREETASLPFIGLCWCARPCVVGFSCF